MSLPPDVSRAVVVLANLMDLDGKLNTESQARLAVAAQFWHDDPGAVLITTGWNYRPDSAIRIADAFRDAAVAVHGIPPSSIVADVCARDTVGDAVFIRRNIIEGSSVGDLVVVSSDYHIDRVREIFSFVFGPQYRISFAGAPAMPGADIAETEQRSIEAFRTTFAGIALGDGEAIYQRLIDAHPFYNGQVHPAIA